MAPIKTVAIAGPSGALAKPVLAALLASNLFTVRVLRRAGSPATFPPGAEVVDVDYSSPASLRAALEGQDAVVSTVGAPGFLDQKQLIDAAAAAGVRRFVPSEFGSNLENAQTAALPVFAPKMVVRKYLVEAASSSPSLTWTAVANGAFLDWGLEHGFVLGAPEPVILDGGDRPFSTTTLGSVADAVVGILTHPEETKNRCVFISNMAVTQNKLLQLAKEVAPQKEWQPKAGQVAPMVAEADKRLAQGLMDMQTWAPYLYKAILDVNGGGLFSETDNALLGVGTKTDEDVKAIMKKIFL